MIFGYLYIRTQFSRKAVRVGVGAGSSSFNLKRAWKEYKMERARKKFQVYMKKHDQKRGRPGADLRVGGQQADQRRCRPHQNQGRDQPPAAAKTVQAHLENLVAYGEVVVRRGPLGHRYERVSAPTFAESEEA